VLKVAINPVTGKQPEKMPPTPPTGLHPLLAVGGVCGGAPAVAQPA
jgi:hypothetical protein